MIDRMNSFFVQTVDLKIEKSNSLSSRGNNQKTTTTDAGASKLHDFVNAFTQDLQGGEKSQDGDLVIPKTTGDREGGYLNPSKQSELDELADFMDQKNTENPGTYPIHNAGGCEGDSWKNELSGKVDNYLNSQEMNSLQQAASDMEAEKAENSLSDESNPTVNSILQLLEKLVEMIQKGASKGGKEGVNSGAQAEGSTEKGSLSGVIKNLEKMIEEMEQKNAINELIERIRNLSNEGENNGGAGKCESNHCGKSGGVEGASGVESATDTGMDSQLMEILNLLIDLVKMIQGTDEAGSTSETDGEQSSGGVGGANGNFSASADPALSSEKMNNALVQTGLGDAYANPSEQNTLDKVAEFMDKNADAFGKPSGNGSWGDALQGERNLNQQDNSTVQDAMNVMQLLMDLLEMLETDSESDGGFYNTQQTYQFDVYTAA